MARIVVMGVAGAGKTTVGRALSARLGAAFVDADDAHPPDNVAKMAAGRPLIDADRRPWLDRLHAELEASEDVVVTCSALRRAYRDHLRGAGALRFVFLAIDPDEARRRLDARRDHFMGAGMVESQFATLEPPAPDEDDVVTVDARLAPEALVESIVDVLTGP